VVSDDIDTAIRAGGHGAGDERVWVVDEHLRARGPVAKHGRGLPAIALGLPEEERRAFDLELDHTTEVPQLAGPSTRSYQRAASSASVTASITRC
jgi:hypothetical protein